MKNCFRDARPEITGITATFDYVENYSEGSSYGGSTLTAGQTVTITRYGTHTFSRLRVKDFFNKPFSNSESGVFVEHSKLAKCGPSNFFDFCNTLDDGDRVLTSGAFVLWATGCCPCDIHLDSVAYPVAAGIERIFYGFAASGGFDGTTYATLQVALPFYYPKHCRFAFRREATYTPPSSPSTPTFTITHAVTGSSTADAEQLITLNTTGLLVGGTNYHWVSPDGDTYKFVSGTLGPENRTTHATPPYLQYVNFTPATAADASNFQITLEDGPSNSYGSFRIAFVGKFANQAVNLITDEGSGSPFVIYPHESPPSDYIQLPDGTQTDVARCGSGDSWTINMAATSTGYTRTGTITFDFIY